MQGPSAPFDHGVLLRDLTATQQTWLEKEAKRHVDNGAGVKAKTRHEEEAYELRQRVEHVLNRLGLKRNEKKGQWVPVQVVEHLGLEVDFKEGVFRVTQAQFEKIASKATDLLCETSQERRWVPVRKLAAFNRLCQSVYLAVPAARLYLRELYFVLTKKRSWGAKVKLTRQSFGDLKWWKRLQAQCNVERATDLEAMAAMLEHFTSRNPDQMRRMRRLWSLLDLNDIELQARHIRSEAKEWADRLSRDTAIDDWKLNRRWFDWVQTKWGEHTVDRFASEISAQLPRRDLSAPSRLGGSELLAARPVPAGGARLEVYWPRDDDCYKGTVSDVAGTGQHHIQYDDEDKEWLQLSEELTRPERLEAEEDNDVAPVDEWTSALRERWRGELGVSRFTVQMQALQQAELALKETTRGNYGPKSKKF
eukprot:gene9989-biopygen10209